MKGGVESRPSARISGSLGHWGMCQNADPQRDISADGMRVLSHNRGTRSTAQMTSRLHAIAVRMRRTATAAVRG